MTTCPNKNSKEYKDLVEKLGSESLANAVWYKEEAKNKEQKESAFEHQIVYAKRRIISVKKNIQKLDKDTVEYHQNVAYLDEFTKKLEEAEKQQSRELFTDLGKGVLDSSEVFIKQLEDGSKKVTDKNLLFVVNTLATFNDFEGLSDKSKELFRRVYPFLNKHTLNLINKYSTENFEITQELIDAQTKDIGTFRASVGALADLANYIGRTIGSIIKAAQNRASSNNKKLASEVQIEVNKLIAYAKSNGKTLEQVYSMFITETDNDLKLVSPMIKIDGEWVANKAFKVIKDNKDLIHFYKYYQGVLAAAEANLPIKVGRYYIPNIHKTSIKYQLTHLINKNDVLFDQFKSNEDLYADIVPEQFKGKISKELKSQNLGASLLEFAAYSNTFHELSEALPETRLLQEQLEWKQLEGGEIKKREFSKSSEPNVRINFEHTNLKKMVNTVIDMQLKGEMSKKQGGIKSTPIKDENGEIIGYKQVHASDVIDLALKYNSMLRIGFSPITAIANVLFGDVSNIIEAIGGRYFGVRQLHQATGIFFSQIQYTKQDKTSSLHEWLEKLNPLMELDDYNLPDKVRLKKMSTAQLQEYMYGMQKQGELYLQSRTMIALLIKQGYMNSKGETTSEGHKLMKDSLKMEQLSDKIQRLNQLIHGRYSSREAAAMQQSVIYRAMVQFRKWIPSAIESRLGEKQYDNRLGMEIEGRYLTLSRLVASKQVFSNLIKMAKGELSEMEMYNMRKNLTELTILAATMLSFLALSSGDDDERKRRLRNPGIKTALTLLNRVAGDLSFFYSPANINQLATNTFPISATVKDLLKTINYLPAAFYYEGNIDVPGIYHYSGDVLKSGSMQGSNPFYSSGSKILIGFKPARDVYKLLSNNVLDKMN